MIYKLFNFKNKYNSLLLNDNVTGLFYLIFFDPYNNIYPKYILINNRTVVTFIKHFLYIAYPYIKKYYYRFYKLIYLFIYRSYKSSFVTYKKQLKLAGVIYKLTLFKNYIKLSLGYSHLIIVKNINLEITYVKDLLTISHKFNALPTLGNIIHRYKKFQEMDSYKLRGFIYPYIKYKLKRIKTRV